LYNTKLKNKIKKLKIACEKIEAAKPYLTLTSPKYKPAGTCRKMRHINPMLYVFSLIKAFFKQSYSYNI